LASHEGTDLGGYGMIEFARAGKGMGGRLTQTGVGTTRWQLEVEFGIFFLLFHCMLSLLLGEKDGRSRES